MAKSKAEKKARKEGKIKEWLGVFTRAYEMARAYKNGVEKSTRMAIAELNQRIEREWFKTPQDRMFFIDCKIEVQLKFKDAMIAVEKGLINA